MEGHEQAVDMEDRQGVQQDVVRRKPPGFVQGQGVGGQGTVGQHGPLGASRRAAGVDDRGQVRRRAGLHPGVRVEGSRLCREGSGVLDEDSGLGVLQEIVHLRRRVGRVQGQEDRTGPQGRKIDHHRVHGLLDLQGDPLARRGAPPPQQVCDPGSTILQVAIADRFQTRLEKAGTAPVRRKPGRQKIIEIVRHVPSLGPISGGADGLG